MRKFLSLLIAATLLSSWVIAVSPPPKIYDCFLFYNELELLEIRLHELYPYVDHFVLVEANETHRKAEAKPFLYELNQERFARFKDKIIHIKLEEHFETEDPWQREYWQRNQIVRGLTKCEPNDIIMISDVDEFIPGNVIPRLDKELKVFRSIVCVQKMYRWFLNRSCDELWDGMGIVRYKELVERTPQGVRHAARTRGLRKRWSIGWHFSNMGGYEKNVQKIRGVVEGQDIPLAPDEWRRQINAHRFVAIDKSYPKFVQENIQYLIDRKMIDTDSNQLKR